MRRASALIALLFAALLGAAPVAALPGDHGLENAVLELAPGQIRDSVEKRAEPGSVTPDVDGHGDDEAPAAGFSPDFVRESRSRDGAVFAALQASAPSRSYQARAPPQG